MALQTLSFQDHLVIEECYKCSCRFGMPQYLQRQAREEGRSFFCPNGHSQVYQKTDLQIAKDAQRAAERREQYAINSRDSARRDAKHQKGRAAAYKGQATRQRKKAGAGVCPVPKCKRHFENLGRHMKSKHPGWGDAEVTS